MPVYEYRGLDKSGEQVEGIQDAESQSVLRKRLQAKGIYVTEISEGGEGGLSSSRDIDFEKMFERVGLRDISVLTRQLGTLLGSGIPLVEALTALSEQVEKEELERILSDIRQKVNEGSSLANAMEDHPEHFSDLYINMVKAGESSGNLGVVLERLTEFLEAKLELRSQVIGAMVYPIIMMLVGIGILLILFTFVIPKVTQIFEDQGAALPWITELLIGVSNTMASWWGFVIMFAFGGACYGFYRWKNTEEGKDKWDRFVLKVPVFGELVRMIAIERFARTLGTLLASGVPLLTAFDIVKEILGNNRLVEVVENARVNIREGEDIADPLKRSGEFPPLVTHMISIGERSGQLEQMLGNVAEAYDQEVEIRIDAMTTLLEPIMIVLMGGVVGFIVFAIMLPILQLNQTVGGM